VLLVVSESHALVCDVSEVNVLANPGRGVTVIKTDDDINVIGFAINEPLTLESEKGKITEVKPLKKDRVPRGSKGSLVFTRKEKAARVVLPPPSVPPQLAPLEASKSESKE
jgi:DNA gyrase subunit A